MFAQGVGVGQRFSLTSQLGLGSGQFAQVFVPDYFVPPANGAVTLVFHLHSASWAAEDQVYKAHANAVLFNIHLGGFSSSYETWFADTNKFQAAINATLNVLKTNGMPNASVRRLVVTSFSAGYAGVREVLEVPAYYSRIDALNLADGLHSSSAPASRLLQLTNFVRFARGARDGHKIFLLTHSSIVTSGYDSTTTTADYLINGVGGTRVPFSATDDIGTQYLRCDAGDFHVKGYLGATASDHLDHLYAMNVMLSNALVRLDASSPVDLLAPQLLTNGTIRVALASNSANQLIEAATNLPSPAWQPWLALGDTNAWIEKADALPARFYRARSVPVQLLTDFESFLNGSSALFQRPSYSGSTSNFLDLSTGNSDLAWITNGAGYGSARGMRVAWSFKAGANNPWLRVTTFNATNLPNPTIRLGQSIQFDLLCDRDIFIAAGLRETATSAAVGADGGTSGTIEWVGGVTDNTLSPPRGRLVRSNQWTTVLIPFAPARAFTGNGVLESASGKVVFEHLAIVPASGLGAHQLWLDNLRVVDVTP